MENQNGISEYCQINNSERPRFFAYPDFSYSFPYRLKWLPVFWIIAFLNLAELKSCLRARIIWEIPEAC